MAPHSSTLALKIPWMEEPGRLQSRGSQESDRTEQLHFHFHLGTLPSNNTSAVYALMWAVHSPDDCLPPPP